MTTLEKFGLVLVVSVGSGVLVAALGMLITHITRPRR